MRTCPSEGGCGTRLTARPREPDAAALPSSPQAGSSAHLRSGSLSDALAFLMTGAYAYVCICAYVHACTCAYVHVYTCVQGCVYVGARVCVRVCLHPRRSSARSPGFPSLERAEDRAWRNLGSSAVKTEALSAAWSPSRRPRLTVLPHTQAPGHSPGLWGCVWPHAVPLRPCPTRKPCPHSGDRRRGERPRGPAWRAHQVGPPPRVCSL